MGIVLNKNYALREALIYTIFISIILLMPLYIYYTYSKSIYETRNKFVLQRQAKMIIQTMEQYDSSNNAYFTYPRFISLESGLYDEQFKAVFSLISVEYFPTSLGYHILDDRSYLVVKLPNKRFFNASFLVVSSMLHYWPIYQKVAMVLLSIVIVIYFLSLFFLRRFAQPYERVNRQLDNFIKDTVHEINTPLTIINTNVDLYNIKEGENKYFSRIKAASKTLGSIYDDMDYLIKNENINFEQDEIDLSEFVQRRVDYFDEVARQKAILIQSHVDKGVKILFNISQLQRIVDNNISNAIKYSYEANMVIITLLLNDDGEVELSFKDFGIGIEEPNKIFERYYREDRDKGGFGIGLNIVKNIIDSVGIKLDIKSEFKHGSTFTYTFPSSMRC